MRYYLCHKNNKTVTKRLKKLEKEEKLGLDNYHKLKNLNLIVKILKTSHPC